MIYEEPFQITPGEKRAVVACDKPACPESTYMPGVGSYTAAQRMRAVGWEVAVSLSAGDAPVRGYAARCPEHATQGPAPAHEHQWKPAGAMAGYDVCRTCGTRRDP